jgi:mannose-1-phosphate guanylyltransferase
MVVRVILAGGKGERLWPLSQPHFPKPFLPIYPDGQSLIQKTAQRLAGAESWVVAPERLRAPVSQHLPLLPSDRYVCEPLPRGTLTAAALVLARLTGLYPPSTVVGFFPADHHIPNTPAFQHSLAQAEQLAREVPGLVTLGLSPSYPATGYGYIRWGEPVATGYRVERFVEKPDQATAVGYLEQGGWYWNSGMFVGQLEVWQQEIARYAPQLLALGDDWTQYPVQSLDRGLMEKSHRVYTLPANFDWSDLGDWQALEQFWAQIGSSPYAAQTLDLGSQDVAVFSTDPAEQVLTVGLEGVIVVRAGHLTLVINRQQAQYLPQLLGKL